MTRLIGLYGKRFREKKDDSVSAEKRESVKALREQAKKAIAGVKETYFYAPESVWKEDMVSAGESVKTLVSLVKAVRRKVCGKEARQKYDRF